MKRLLPYFLSAVFMLLVGCKQTSEAATALARDGDEGPEPPMMSANDIALGKSLYVIHCASCHGENLEGEANWKQQNDDGSFRSPPHSADGHTWHHADHVLNAAIKEGGARFEGLNIGGSSNMPAFGPMLTDEQINAVLVYIKSTWPEDVRRIQWQQTVQSEAQ